MDTRTLKLIMPRAPAARIDAYARPLDEHMASTFIDTPLRQAHFLAQIAHETGELRWLEEIADGRNYEGRRDLGNVREGDGRRFKGRGLIQLTGRANYEAFSIFLDNIDVLATPSIVATDPDLSTQAATWFWRERRLNTLADADNLEGITRRINGGLNGLADRREALERAKRALGV